LLAYRVAFVKNKNTILFNVDAETQPQIYQAAPNDIIVNGLAPLSATFSTNLLGERIWTIDGTDATVSARGFMTAAQATLLGTHTTQIATNAFDITQRAPIVHTHIVADVTGLQGALDGKSNVGHNHDLLYFPLNGNFDTRYPLLGHTHLIGDVSGLQTALNLKSDVGHIHIIANVTGLQDELDAKFNVTDFLPLGQVSGLASALALKSNIGHTHVIADVSGLQTALDGKISFTNTTIYTPSADYNPATKKYVDDTSAPLANKVTGAVAGNFAALNASGNLTDSGRSAGSFVLMAGDTMTGFLTLSSDPTLALHAATKQYVDNQTFVIGSINQHTDVDTATVAPATNDVLKWNGTNWVPGVGMLVVKPSPLNVINSAATVYDFGSAADHNTSVRLTAALPIIVLVHNDTFFGGTDLYYSNNFNPTNPGPMPVGGSALFGKHGAGNITFQADAGVTINYPDTFTVSKINAKVTLIKAGPNEWDLEGHLDPA
jgi:hypothetical protein